MTQNQMLWAKATKLLADATLFDRERERVLEQYPLLNSHGLGFTERRRRTSSGSEKSSGNFTIERIPEDLSLARAALRAGGTCENGIRNTLIYIVEGRISLSYRLRGCGWARRFNGPAPMRQSSYRIKTQVESYFAEKDRQSRALGIPVQGDSTITNGAFICAVLMLGLRIWRYQNSTHPDVRLGKPWAVAGLQPEDFGDSRDIQKAQFWRWVAQHEITNESLETFVSRTVELLYEGASLDSLNESVCSEGKARSETFEYLLSEYANETNTSIAEILKKPHRFGFMAGEISIPEDFDTMFSKEIEELFGLQP